MASQLEVLERILAEAQISMRKAVEHNNSSLIRQTGEIIDEATRKIAAIKLK